MPYFIPVQYHKCRYPKEINPKISEVAGHFDISKINASGDYSLHTEYSFTSRKFESDVISKYKLICEANKKGIPMLWHSEEWALEFADFLRELTKDHIEPKVIEIHPPFSDYSHIDSFIKIYGVFQNKIKIYFPNVKVLIENRSGTRYYGGKFILSNIEQLVELSSKIDQNNVDLRITLDIPQLFTTHQISKSKIDPMEKLFKDIKSIRHNILGIHLWGKRESANGRRVAHIGDLDSYFMGDIDFKKKFLKSMHDSFNDEVYRYFVPEVNSGSEDLNSIVRDLISVGFKFYS